MYLINIHIQIFPFDTIFKSCVSADNIAIKKPQPKSWSQRNQSPEGI